jgi:hypothetical protein
MREKDITTMAEAKNYVLNNEDPIDMLINPSDLIHQDIESWDNVDIDRLRDELAGGMGDSWTYGINHPYGDLIERIAIERFVEDMQRISMDHLNPEVFRGIEDMVIEGYWPYQTNNKEIRELVYEWKDDIEFFHEYESEVMYEIESYIIDARLKNLE